MTDVSWMLEVWGLCTLKGHSIPTAPTPRHCIDRVLQMLPMNALSWGSKPAACGGPPPLSLLKLLAEPPTSLPTALLCGFPIPVTSCPHLPAASPGPVWGETVAY